MFSKIDCKDVFRDHTRTFVDSAGKTLFGDVVVFYVLPLALAAALAFERVTLSESLVSLLLNAFSIFAALLLNLIVLVHGMVRRYRRDASTQLVRRVLQELFANLSYGVMLCIIGIVALVVHQMSANEVLRLVLAPGTYFVATNFILTLLVILKRVHILMGVEFGDPDNQGGPA